MEFRIADTFTDSLARLTGEEQKSVKTTAFDLQMNPAGTGMSFHRLEKAKDKNKTTIDKTHTRTKLAIDRKTAIL